MRYPVLFALLLAGCASDALDAHEIVVEIEVDERMQDFCRRLEKRDLWKCSEFQEIAAQKPFAQFRFLPAPRKHWNRFEGMFRPGIYKINNDAGLHDLILQMLEITKKDLNNMQAASQPDYRDMILASIVEKEAASNRDYKRIAAVFLNRLEKNQKLGSCPTVEYALGYHRPFLLFKDLDLKSPYNVYKRKGLPPTPIAFFSKDALHAVLNPAQSKHFFFVYDWTTGDLHFTAHYAQHKRNAQRARENFIRKYGRANMYRAFPDLFYESIDGKLN